MLRVKGGGKGRKLLRSFWLYLLWPAIQATCLWGCFHHRSSGHFPSGMGWENFSLNNNNCPRVVSASRELKVAKHSFYLFCYYNSACTLGLQKTNMPSIVRVIIFIYSTPWPSVLFFSIIKRSIEKVTMQRTQQFSLPLFVTERTQLNGANVQLLGKLRPALLFFTSLKEPSQLYCMCSCKENNYPLLSPKLANF